MTEKWDYLVSDEKFEDLIRNYCTDFTANAKVGRYNVKVGEGFSRTLKRRIQTKASVAEAAV